MYQPPTLLCLQMAAASSGKEDDEYGSAFREYERAEHIASITGATAATTPFSATAALPKSNSGERLDERIRHVLSTVMNLDQKKTVTHLYENELEIGLVTKDPERTELSHTVLLKMINDHVVANQKDVKLMSSVVDFTTPTTSILLRFQHAARLNLDRSAKENAMRKGMMRSNKRFAHRLEVVTKEVEKVDEEEQSRPRKRSRFAPNKGAAAAAAEEKQKVSFDSDGKEKEEGVIAAAYSAIKQSLRVVTGPNAARCLSGCKMNEEELEFMTPIVELAHRLQGADTPLLVNGQLSRTQHPSIQLCVSGYQKLTGATLHAFQNEITTRLNDHNREKGNPLYVGRIRIQFSSLKQLMIEIWRGAPPTLDSFVPPAAVQPAY